jgi:hypothetical protein
VVPVHSWVSTSHGARTFFAPAAYLPTTTPPALQQLRANELAALRVRVWDILLCCSCNLPTSHDSRAAGHCCSLPQAEPATNDSLSAAGRARRADSDRKYGYQVWMAWLSSCK